MDHLEKNALAIQKSPRETARTSLIIGGLIAVALIPLAMYYHSSPNTLLTDFFQKSPLTTPYVVLLSVLTSMGLGTLIGVFASNRHRIRAVLRPNAGRFITTCFMVLLTPVIIFGILPVTPLWLVTISRSAKEFAMLFGVSIGLLCVWYPISSMIISGIKSKWMRIAVFAQIWITLYALHFLITGYLRFTL